MVKEVFRRKDCEAPRPQGASCKRNLIYIVPLDPACKAGLAGHLPAKGAFGKAGQISYHRNLVTQLA